MSEVSKRPKIYHITHLQNLESLIGCGCLWSDAQRLQQGFTNTNIGMGRIKERRLKELEVACHSGTKVGEYVPFYFCPRSIMLYLLYQGNHPDITYREGQGPIVHLQADLHRVVAWAEEHDRAWAFSTSNAGAIYTDFYDLLNDLDTINWEAVAAIDFRAPAIKEGKQAEFLMFDSFPWELVEQVGVINQAMSLKVLEAVKKAKHQPVINIHQEWYY